MVHCMLKKIPFLITLRFGILIQIWKLLGRVVRAVLFAPQYPLHFTDNVFSLHLTQFVRQLNSVLSRYWSEINCRVYQYIFDWQQTSDQW